MGYNNNSVMNDYMTAAIEGGSASWMNDREDCSSVSVSRDTEGNIVRINCTVNGGTDKWEDKQVDAAVMRKGLKALAADEKQPEHLRKLAKAMLTDEDIDYDAGDADTALQYALFGDIVYG